MAADCGSAPGHVSHTHTQCIVGGGGGGSIVHSIGV